MSSKTINRSGLSVKDFLKQNFKHFNAATVVDAAEGWVNHLRGGGKMFLTLAGAMSTGEIGISLAELIREGKVHGISSTGANLEEDIFNLVAHDEYKRIPEYRQLSANEESELRAKGFNRVTDTCIPEEEALRKIERHVLALWKAAEEKGERFFPYEFIYQLVKSGALENEYQIDPKNSWVIAAAEKNIPIYTPGWEDSTLGNFYVANNLKGNLKSFHTVRSGAEQMAHLVEWYTEQTQNSDLGFFQIGGGIAGDFAICTVPLLIQDLKKEETKLWSYFAQISDSTTSFGSYSGAVPNEKISWGKLDESTPRFVIESDASIVAPLIFQYVLESEL